MTQSQKRVLIVEDEVDLRAVLKELAAMSQLEPFEAGNGAEALEILQTHGPFDLILSDIRMPKLGGLDLLKEIRQQGLVTPFYVLTAFDDVSEHQIYALKGNGIFYKPVNMDALTAFFEGYQ